MIETVETTTELHEKLQYFFGFSKFKGEQEAIIRNILNRNDTFVIMPTGGGKSLCYQFSLPSVHLLCLITVYQKNMPVF